MPSLNFPTSPTLGQQYNDWVWNGGQWDFRQTLPGGLPAGAIIQWGGSTAPVNWLLCDGSAVSRTTYASLFAAVGTSYGTGDGSTTFNLPDLRGRVPVGKNGGSFGTLGATGGAETVTLTESQMPSHTHTGTTSTNGDHTHAIYGSNGGSAGASISITGNSNNDRSWYLPGGIAASAGSHNHSFTTGATGGGGAHTNLQPYQVVNYIIKATAAATPGESELAPRVGALESTRALKAGDTFTGTIIGKTNTGGGQASSYDSGSFSARGDSTNAAVVSFHRPGSSATNVGIDTDNKFKIGGWSFPIDSLSIDMSGRVITASQPAFLCYTSTGTAHKAGGSWSNIAAFPTSGGAATAVAYYNIGSHWNSANGRFTAPVAGRYVFQVGGWANYNGAGNRYAYCFQQNGGAYNFIGGGGTTAADSPMAGYSAILNLAAGDYIDLAMFSAVTMGMGSPSHYMWWGGYLLG